MSFTISSSVITIAESLATLADRLEGNPEIEGFHLTWLNYSDSGVISISEAPIGNVRSPYGGPTGVKGYSNEKALRAAAHRLRDPEAISSFQTANPDLGMYQGAVIFPRMNGIGFDVLSASAYAAPRDEAVILRLGAHIPLCGFDFIRRVVRESNNDMFEPLLQADRQVRRSL